MKSSIGLELFTSLIYIFISPFCFEIINTSEVYRQGIVIYFIMVILAFITGTILFIISISLDRIIQNRITWAFSRIIIGILIFETSSLILMDSSLIYGFYSEGNMFQEALTFGNITALGIVYILNYLFVRYSKIR